MEISVTRDQKVVSILYFHPLLDKFTSNCKMEYNTSETHFKILSWSITDDNHFEHEKPKTYASLCEGGLPRNNRS